MKINFHCHTSYLYSFFTNIINRIAITTKGKYAFIKAEAIPLLVSLINDELSEMRVNSLKV